jgi:hypothetical protein
MVSQTPHMPPAASISLVPARHHVASCALAQPKSDLSDFGRFKVPNSGKPEFGAGEGTMVWQTSSNG